MPRRRNTEGLHPPPPLPARLVNPVPMTVVGTGLWFAAFLLLLALRLAGVGPDPVWMWTCLAGSVLGLVGMRVIRVQRRAARRGGKSAQRGA